MIVEMPEPVPLDMPAESPEALGDVVHDVAGAVFHLSVLAGALDGPAAEAPGWLGDDAAAAVVQVGAVAALARQAADGVLAAMHRLSAHADCLHEARREVAALEQEQQEDFAAAWARLGRIENPQLAVMTLAPEWVGTVEELRASEAARRRRHAALLEGVADDAAATSRVLADSCAAIGGRGAAGDAERVLAHVAAQLPGWGQAELAARGEAFAELFRQPFDPARLDARARESSPLAGTPAFAVALLTALGEQGMRDLLMQLGDGDFGSGNPLAGLLVAVIRGAEPAAGAHDPVGEVLTATYVDAADPGYVPDRIVLGMSVLLAAAATGRSGTLPPSVLGRWGRQIIGREHAQGARAVDRVNVLGPYVPADPVPLVVDLLGAQEAHHAAAVMLADREVWTVLLSREWEHKGLGLARLVRVAVDCPGPAGGTALSAGLEALGTGLADGDPGDWTVVPASAAAVNRFLAVGVMQHLEVVSSLLASASAGPLSPRGGDILRGLGYLSLDRVAAVWVGKGLATWVVEQPVDVNGSSPAAPIPAVAVPAAYLAVQEYGQEIAYAMQGYAAKKAAEDFAVFWTSTFGVLTYVPGPVGRAWGFLEPIVALAVGADGSWTNGQDTGPVWSRENAADAVRAQVAEFRARDPEASAAAAEMVRQARAAFDRVSETLGSPQPPEPPDIWERLLAAFLGEVPDGTREVTRGRRGHP
jgi:hypothetical protein